MAFIGPVLMAIQAISTVLNVVGAIQAGDEAAAAHKANATILANQAANERAIAAEKARRQAFINRRIISQQKTDFGASGVDPAEGSPLEVISDSVAQGKLQELDLLYTGEVNATNLLNQASFEKYNARLARTTAQRKAFTSLLSGSAGTGLTGYQTGVFSPGKLPGVGAGSGQIGFGVD